MADGSIRIGNGRQGLAGPKSIDAFIVSFNKPIGGRPLQRENGKLTDVGLGGNEVVQEPTGEDNPSISEGGNVSAEVSFRMQGGIYSYGQGGEEQFDGLNTDGPSSNPQNLLNFSFLEINDNAFVNMSRFNFDLNVGTFADGDNISLNSEVDNNGPIAHDPLNFIPSSNSSDMANNFALNYEITNTGLNMSMRNYRAAFLKINYRNGIVIDGINHDTEGVLLPADDFPTLSDPFRVGELAGGAFFPSSATSNDSGLGGGVIPNSNS